MKVIGPLLIAGLIVAYWWVALAVLLIYLVVKAAPVAYRELKADQAAERQYLQGLIARADLQHRQASEGDVRGVYGLYPV